MAMSLVFHRQFANINWTRHDFDQLSYIIAYDFVLYVVMIAEIKPSPRLIIGVIYRGKASSHNPCLDCIQIIDHNGNMVQTAALRIADISTHQRLFWIINGKIVVIRADVNCVAAIDRLTLPADVSSKDIC
jgi:hypothetical protein